MICDEGIKDHELLADVPGLPSPTEQKPKAVLGKRSVASRDDVERIIKRPRIFGPDDPSEVTDISDRPFTHIAGIAASQRSLAIALEAEAKEATSEEFTTKLFSGETKLKKADVPSIVIKLLLRADGLALTLNAMKAHYDHEYKKLEEANGDLRVFFPTVKEIVSSWSQKLGAPPEDTEDFVDLSRAARALDQEKTKDLYKTIFLSKLKERVDAEIDRLKTMARARSAAGKQDTKPKPGPSPAATTAIPHPPAPTLRSGRNGNASPSLACIGCRTIGHLVNNCPDATSTSTNTATSSANSGKGQPGGGRGKGTQGRKH